MKHVLVFLGLAVGPLSGIAQRYSEVDRIHEVKINLPSLAIKTLSVQYERGFGGALSGALGLRIGPETSVPFKGLFSNNGSDTSSRVTDQAVSSLRTNSFALTPEVRYYFSGTTAHGFYLALFGRYASSGISSSFETEDDKFANGLRPVTVSGRYRSGGVGLLAGVKWRIRDRVSVDWWIAGPMYTRGNIKIEVQTDVTKMDAENRDNIRSSVEKGLEIGGQQINGNVTFGDNSFSIEGPLSMVQLRTGLAIGIAF